VADEAVPAVEVGLARLHEPNVAELLEAPGRLGTVHFPECRRGVDIDRIEWHCGQLSEVRGVIRFQGADGRVECGADRLAVEAEPGQPSGVGEPFAEVGDGPARADRQPRTPEMRAPRRGPAASAAW
jgi:hypothetical protein